MNRSIAKAFGVGLLAGVIGVMTLGEPIGASFMKFGAKLRNVSAPVSEYEGDVHPAYSFAEELPTSQRKQVRR